MHPPRKSLSDLTDWNFWHFIIPTLVLSLILSFVFIIYSPDIYYADMYFELFHGSEELVDTNMKSYSFIKNIRDLWNVDAHAIAILTGCTTFSLPVLRMIVLLLIWYYPMPKYLRNIALLVSEAGMKFQFCWLFAGALTELSFDGDQSLPDDYSFKITSKVEYLHPWYMTAILISCFLTNILTYLHRQQSSRKTFGADTANFCERMFFAFLASCGLVLFFILLVYKSSFVQVQASGLFKKTLNVDQLLYIHDSTLILDPLYMWFFRDFYYLTLIAFPVASFGLSIIIICTDLHYLRCFPTILRLLEIVHCYSLLEVQWITLVISSHDVRPLAENVLRGISICDSLEKFGLECFTMEGSLGDGCWFYLLVIIVQFIVCNYVKFVRLHTSDEDLVFAALNETVHEKESSLPSSDVRISESTTQSEPPWMI